MSAGVSPSWASFGRRLAGALRLDGETYREIARSADALAQAVAVLLLTSAASAIVSLVDDNAPGLSVQVDWSRYPVARESSVVAALAGGVLDASWGLIVWAVQVTIIWIVWNRFAAKRCDWRRLGAPLGFANAPLILTPFLAQVPLVGVGLEAAGTIWMLAASVIALRAALATGWGWAVALLIGSVAVLVPVGIVVFRVFS